MKVRESGMPEEVLWATFFDAPKILRTLGLGPDADVVELGCGYGTFTVAAGGMTTGIIHALDIEPEMIAIARRKCEAEGQKNVRFILRDFVAEGTGLPAASADYAMLFNILHAPEPIALLSEAFRVLRPGSQVAVIHWNPTDTPRGPDPAIRPKPSQCVAWLLETGFGIVLPPTPLPPYHFGLVGWRS